MVQRIKLVRSDDAQVDDTHGIQVQVLGHAALEGGNTEPVVTTPANTVDQKVTLDSEHVIVEPGTADLNVSLNGESVLIDNTADLKITMDGEAVATTGAPAVSGGVIIANGQSLSAEVDLAGATILAISMPAAFTGTVLTFQAARATGGTFRNIYDDSGTEVSLTVAADRMVAIDFAALKLAPFRYLKIRSGTAATPTAEGAERTLYLITK